jgi:TPR repeat protein
VKRDKNNLISLRLQAMQGDVWAQFTLGEMFRKGEGVAQNYTEAARWYRRLAANSICSTAEYLLASILFISSLTTSGISDFIRHNSIY